MLVFPNAKINIGLHVGPKRNDNFHSIETVYYPVKDQIDALELLPSQLTRLDVLGLAIAGDVNQNLIMKAYQVLTKYHKKPLPPIQFYLKKNIAMGAGLGGGSSDGTFALMAMNQFYNLQLSNEILLKLALELGSDCPFFVHNSPCFATGRGEKLVPIELNLSAYTIRIVTNEIHINTAEAFANITPRTTFIQLQKLIMLPIKEWKESISNDFENYAFEKHPELAQIKNNLYDSGAIYASMTGSGSALYGLFAR